MRARVCCMGCGDATNVWSGHLSTHTPGTHAHTLACAHTCILTRTYICACAVRPTHISTHMHRHSHLHACSCACMYTHRHSYAHIPTDTCKHAYRHVHIHTYKHSHSQTHTHTPVQPSLAPLGGLGDNPVQREPLVASHLNRSQQRFGLNA